MQAIAAENNLAETAFVLANGSNYRIRWFTPSVEVDLCGHTTLASAHVIFNYLQYSKDTITFLSKSGQLHVRKEKDILYLNFPADKIKVAKPTKAIINGLGSKPIKLYKGRDDYLAIFDNEKTISSLSPNMTILCSVPSRGIIVSAPGDACDFVSRFYAPQIGIPEDPVTGSAHTSLIPYWSKKLGKQYFHARQISKRGGEFIYKHLDSRVEIGGRAVTYLVGEISL